MVFTCCISDYREKLFVSIQEVQIGQIDGRGTCTWSWYLARRRKIEIEIIIPYETKQSISTCADMKLSWYCREARKTDDSIARDDNRFRQLNYGGEDASNVSKARTSFTSLVTNLLLSTQRQLASATRMRIQPRSCYYPARRLLRTVGDKSRMNETLLRKIPVRSSLHRSLFDFITTKYAEQRSSIASLKVRCLPGHRRRIWSKFTSCHWSDRCYSNHAASI